MYARVCIWRCEHARFCVEVFYALYINFHSFIHACPIMQFYIGSFSYAPHAFNALAHPVLLHVGSFCYPPCALLHGELWLS